LNFVPPLFCVYLLALPAAVLWPWILVPLAAYGLVVILQTLALFPRSGWLALPVLPLIVITHVFYGLGFWKGLFTKLDGREGRNNLQVSLETSNP
jgi:hypothetical protein